MSCVTSLFVSMVGQQNLQPGPVQHKVQKDRIRFWSLDFASANATARRPSHGHTLAWVCADACKPLHPSRAAIRRHRPRPWQGCSPSLHHLSEMAPQHWQSDWTDHKLRYRINSSQRDLRRCWAGSMYSVTKPTLRDCSHLRAR